MYILLFVLFLILRRPPRSTRPDTRLPYTPLCRSLRLPTPSRHVRIDSGVVEGDTVTIFYDPMIAKLVVWDEDRPRALARLREALAQCGIEGPKSNIAFLERLVRHPVVVDRKSTRLNYSP